MLFIVATNVVGRPNADRLERRTLMPILNMNCFKDVLLPDPGLVTATAPGISHLIFVTKQIWLGRKNQILGRIIGQQAGAELAQADSSI